MKRYNILFLTSWFPNKIKPQAGNFIKNHALCVSSFCNVFVIYVRAREQKEEIIIEENSNDGILELIAYYKKYNSKFPLLSFVIKFKDKIHAYKKTYKYLIQKVKSIDLVHVNVMLPAGVFAKILLKKYKIPYIITEHWTKFLSISNDSFTFLEKKMIKNIGKKASAICPVSKNLKNEMIQFGLNNKYFVVPNVVNTNIFFPPKQEVFHQKIRFLHISHLEDKHKNVSGILNSFKKLSSFRSDFFLTISGNRNIEIHKAYAEKLNFPKKMICFEGSKSQEEVAESMRNHDVFIMFSNYENLPCVISEAHVTGIPVISSDVGGVSEMIDDGNGILVDAGNEAMLLEKIIQIMDNIKEYSKGKISEKAKERYSYESVGNKYYEIYKNVLTQTKKLC